MSDTVEKIVFILNQLTISEMLNSNIVQKEFQLQMVQTMLYFVYMSWINAALNGVLCAINSGCCKVDSISIARNNCHYSLFLQKYLLQFLVLVEKFKTL